MTEYSFDEFDSLAGKDNLNQVVRGSMLNYIADESRLRGRDSKILFIAATNFYDNIDDAMKRKGRIDAHIFMDNPTVEDGQEILRQFIAKEDIVEIRSDDFIAQAYKQLTDEKRATRIREDAKATNWQSLISRNLGQDSDDDRPSGADLKTFYRELKEIAFKNNFRTESKLIFDERVLAQRFRH